MRLVPALMVVAFVAVPASANAFKYKKNNVPIPPGEKVAVVSWGTLTLTANPPAAAPTTCENAALGEVENNEAGEGEGRTNIFGSTNCKHAECEKGEFVGELEKEFRVLPEGENGGKYGLPWPSKLVEIGGDGKIRSESTHVLVSLGCTAHGVYGEGAINSKPAPGFVGGKENFYFTAPTLCKTEPGFIQAPFTQPSGNLPVTAKIKFDPTPGNSGFLSCAGGVVKGETSGSLKIAGYLGLEKIDTAP